MCDFIQWHNGYGECLLPLPRSLFPASLISWIQPFEGEIDEDCLRDCAIFTGRCCSWSSGSTIFCISSRWAPCLPARRGVFAGLLLSTHYVYAVGAVMVISAVLLLVNRFVALGLTLLGPVLVNILLFHLLMQPQTIGAGLFATLLWLLVAGSTARHLKGCSRRFSSAERGVRGCRVTTIRKAMIQYLYLGRVGYDDGLRLQAGIAALVAEGRLKNVLLLLEHPPVLTLGRNAQPGQRAGTDQMLPRAGVTLHEINRGGDVTYHGPGQLVGYPIFDLRTLKNRERRTHGAGGLCAPDGRGADLAYALGLGCGRAGWRG